MLLRPVPAVAIAAALAMGGCASGPGVAVQPAPARYPVPGEFRADGVSTKEVLVRVRKGQVLPFKTTNDGILARIGYVSVDIPAGQTAEQIITSLKDKPGVLDVQPNRYYKGAIDEPAEAKAAPIDRFLPALTIGDPLAGEMYHLAVTKALQAWETTMGAKSTRLALIDSGIDPDHPDLKPQLDPQVGLYNVFTKDGKVHDANGHGTHTAGIAAAAANNREGGAGMAPGVSLLAVQVSNWYGGGEDSKSVAAGFIWATDNGASVINASLGIRGRDKLIEDAVQYALDRDVVCVASAGNEGAENDSQTKPHLPGSIPGVIEVAATDSDDKVADFSNWGKTVSVAAPGVDILSTMPVYPNRTGQQTYGRMSGTSMAAPCVSGAAALLRSLHPDWRRDRVKAAIEKAAEDLGQRGFDVRYGHGRLDALSLVRAR